MTSNTAFMRNRLTPIYERGPARAGGSAFDVDAEPGVRLVWLFVLMTLPLLVVAGRLIHLQGFVAEGFAIGARHETESVEAIPARNGRILSSDGTVLACDEERYQILVHYRWLEQPPNDRWLRDEALARLRRTERKDKQKVDQAKVEVLARREVLWRSLAELTEVNPDKLKELTGCIQHRVERLYQLVEERRDSSELAVEPGTSASRSDLPAAAQLPNGSIRQAWQTLKQELTTTPTREGRDPLRIAEQSGYHLLLEDVTSEVIAEIETHPDQYPGVRTDVTSSRIYPNGRVAPHLVGYRGEIEADELKSRQQRFPKDDPLDFRPGDSIGRTGIEQSYDHVLRGVRGQRKIIRDHHGAVVRTEIVRPPKPGRDVVLNFSVALQNKATAFLEEVLQGTNDVASESAETRPLGGCIVAIDVQTGAILAAATAPTFDVNDFLFGTDEVRKALNSDPRRPMFPRATQAMLPPGSVFKTVSAVAVLESYRLNKSQRIDPDQQIDCIGYLKEPNKNRCYHSMAHYGTDLTKAISKSCNVYFFKAAQTLGAQPLVTWADRFGFGSSTGIDLPGERAGNLPRPFEGQQPGRSARAIELASQSAANPDQILPASPWEDDLAVVSAEASTQSGSRRSRASVDPLGLVIGQSELTVTVMQIARMMAAVANDGWLVTPHVAREIVAAPEVASLDEADSLLTVTNGAISVSEPIAVKKERIPGLTESTLARVREGLEEVVLTGTGKAVRMKETSIAGKTGTAENGNKRPDHAWFAGYVPADRPQVAFVVVLEQGGSGGKVAGPVAKKLVQALLEQGLVIGK